MPSAPGRPYPHSLSAHRQPTAPIQPTPWPVRISSLRYASTSPHLLEQLGTSFRNCRIARQFLPFGGCTHLIKSVSASGKLIRPETAWLHSAPAAYNTALCFREVHACSIQLDRKSVCRERGWVSSAAVG